MWTDTDNARCGTLPFVFDDDFNFEKYAEFVLDVPMYFIYRDGRYIDATGHSFRDFVAGKLPFLPGEYATLADWESHLTTVFPEARAGRGSRGALSRRRTDRLLCTAGERWRVCEAASAARGRGASVHHHRNPPFHP